LIRNKQGGTRNIEWRKLKSYYLRIANIILLVKGEATMFALIKEVAMLLGVPILLFIACREWMKSGRESLSQWRNSIALIALLFISLNWLAAVFIDLPILLHRDTSVLFHSQWVIYSLAHIVDLGAIICAFALRNSSRYETILAGILMLVCWPGGYH
jgi:hypothetical protein